MYFLNEDHKKNYALALELYPESRGSTEYQVGCYIMAHPEIFPKTGMKRRIGVFEGWIRQDFSTGIRLLIDAGRNMYGGGRVKFNLNDGITTWDAGNLGVFITACEIRKGFHRI